MDDNQIFLTFDGPGNIVSSLLAAQIICAVFAVVAVVLRFWARRVARVPCWWDDWLILGALAIAIVFNGIHAYWLHIGAGRQARQWTPYQLREAFLIVFITEIVYNVGIFLIKFSVLMLYRRIFVEGWARWYIIIWAYGNFLLTTGTIVTSFLQCRPIWGFWDRLTPGPTCELNVQKIFLLFSIGGVVIDIAAIGLPLALCWRFKTTRRMRILLTGIFATGFFVTVVSGVRIYQIVALYLGDPVGKLNITWTFAPLGMWTVVEVHIGIVSACLPCLRPLLRHYGIVSAGEK